MKRVLKYLWILALCIVSMIANAQDKVEATLQADIVSLYLWRGYQNGHASIQPTLGVKWKGLSLSAWGSVGFTDSSDTNEIDLEASYTIGGLTLRVIDFWTDDINPTYFDYRARNTSHLFEAGVEYNFGLLSLSWQTFFAGNDYQVESDKRAYSSYIEMDVPFNLATCQWNATLGAVPFASDYYLTNGFKIVNVSLMATKELQITEKFSLPVYAQLVANPNTKQLLFAFGLTIGI